MQRIRRASLILLMLCSMCAVFIVQAGTAIAAGLDNCQPALTVNDPSGSTMNCVPDDSANPAPAPTTAPEQQPAAPVTQPGPWQGKIDGDRAGRDAPPGTEGECPQGNTVEYCDAWKKAYDAAQAAKAQQPGQGGGMLLNNVIGAAIGATIVVGVIILLSTPAGGVAAGAAARFFGKKP